MAAKGGLGGKGLTALFTDNEENVKVEVKDMPTVEIAIAEIDRNPNQPRKTFTDESLKEMASSIAAYGVLQPLLVRDRGDYYEIVAGERRYQAARAAGLDEVPVIIRDVSDDDVFKLALIENLQRSDLSPLEEANGYRQLIREKGLTQEELARILSKSRSTITNTLRLLDLPDEVQELVETGRLTAGHARAILAVPDEEGRIALAKRVVSEHLSVRQTESLASTFSVNQEDKPRRAPLPQSFKRAARQMRLALDTNVRVKNVRGKNKIEIEFASEDELAHIVDLLAGPRTWS